MFKRGDKVDLTYYKSDGQVEGGGWLVEDYDNGLMKVTKTNEDSWLTMIGAKEGKKPPEKEGKKPPKKETVVFNLRSIGFLKAKLVE